jgi:Na+-driven multidrug efflux pump
VLIKRRDHGLRFISAFLPFFGLAFAATFFALAFPLPPPILNILVPQTEHVPDIALRPFFMIICFSPFISLFFLHFTQYACVIKVNQAKLK